MNKFISKNTFKVVFDDGEYIELREDVPYEEQLTLFAIENPTQRMIEMMMLRVIGWNLKDADGKDMPFTREAIRQLNEDSFAHIAVEINKYFINKQAGESKKKQ